MLALYILSLVISSGFVGVFIRQVLGELGFVGGFQAGIMLAGSVGLAYAALQLLYMAFVSFVVGQRSRALYTCEILSHSFALLFIGYLIRLDVAWPHEVFEKVEPLVYLGIFLAGNSATKLATFYASLRGTPGSRWAYAGFGLSALLCAAIAFASLGKWLDENERSRPMAAELGAPERPSEIQARSVPEGSTIHWEGSFSPEDKVMTLLLSLPLDEGIGQDKVYVSAQFVGDETEDYFASVSLNRAGWAEFVVPADSIPENVESASFTWARDPLPKWQRILRVRPVVYRASEDFGDAGAPPPVMMIAGPILQARRVDNAQPNVVLIAVDGLSPEHLSMSGNVSVSTPSLDRFGGVSQVFEQAYSSSPDVTAAYMTLFTGLVPTQHLVDSNVQHFETPRTLAEVARHAGFATAAFTEGEAPHGPDLIGGSGFEYGFDTFDASFPGSREDEGDLTSGVTVGKVQSWIRRHADRKFFVFARLRELEHLHNSERYAEFLTDTETEVDDFTRAVAFLDSRIGALVKSIRDRNTRRNTVIVLMSPYSKVRSRDRVPLSDAGLRMTMLVHIPGVSRGTRRDTIGLEDLPVTLAAVMGLSFPEAYNGLDFANQPNRKRPVAVQKDPKAYSLRTGNWRYTWTPDEKGEALYRFSGATDWWYRDLSGTYPEVTRQFREELSAYLRDVGGAF